MTLGTCHNISVRWTEPVWWFIDTPTTQLGLEPDQVGCGIEFRQVAIIINVFIINSRLS